MSSAAAAPRAAVPMSAVAAPRRAGRTAPGRAGQRPRKARPARRRTRSSTACGHRSIVVLPDEDVAEFAALEAALVEELAPVGALQTVLARRVAVAAWRLARADRIEIELFEERRSADGGLGLALIRDGNGARSFETLLRYRGAAMAEFWRALRTLKALQAEQAQQAQQALGSQTVLAAQQVQIAARPALAPRQLPNEPERAAEPRLDYLPSDFPATAAPCMSPPRPGCRTNPRTTPIGALLTRTSCRARWNQRPRSARGQHQIRALLADHDAAASALPRGPDQPRQGEGPRISAGLWATRAGDRADGSPGHHSALA